MPWGALALSHLLSSCRVFVFSSQRQSAGQKTIRPEGSFSARAHLPAPILASDGLTLGRNPKLTLDVCRAGPWWGRGETKCQKTNTPSLLLHFLCHWRNRLTCRAREGCGDIHSPARCYGSAYMCRGERLRPNTNGRPLNTSKIDFCLESWMNKSRTSPFLGGESVIIDLHSVITTLVIVLQLECAHWTEVSVVEQHDIIWSLLHARCPERGAFAPVSGLLFASSILWRESLFVYMKGNGRFGDQSKLQQKVLQMGTTAISMLLNAERSPNVFVYEGAADLWLCAGVAHRQVKITCCARDHHYELTIGQCSGTINAAPGRHSTSSQCCEILCVILYL